MLRFVLGLALLALAAMAQTTQGVISGRLVSSVTGRPIAQASVSFASDTSTSSGNSVSDENGYYALPLLSPGMYRIRAIAMGYQAQEVQELELAVASRIDLSFRLRPLSDVWEAGQTNSVFLPGQKTIVTFFGPDVDATRTGSFDANKGRRAPLETTVSQVIRSSDIADLPLAGRDAYTMLVTQAGVTSDGATARGLGLSANGQRPSASNFLLDGLENNNYLVTGPLVNVAPQAIQEYRVSTNNYSVEYGRTSGYLANAITRSGANQLHGTAYFFMKNEALNANGFQENLAGRNRAPYKESQPGLWVGGPIRSNRLFFSSAYEYFRSRGQQMPQFFWLPNVAVFRQFAPVGRQSRTLLDTYKPIVDVGGSGLFGGVTLAPPVSVNRHLAIERLDFHPGSRDRIMGSLLLARLGRPDFIWTPYPDFVSPLRQDTWRLSGSHVHTFSSDLFNEVRAAYSHDDLHWDRPHPEIATLVTDQNVTLPGSPAFYAYKNVSKTLELVENLTWTHGAHRVEVGGGGLLRNVDGALTAGRDGLYEFSNITSFALDRPSFFRTAIQRSSLPAVTQPQYDRSYRYRQYFGFVQDTLRVTSRLTANIGLRYESFGAPSNVGATKDALVQLGPGGSLANQLAGASLGVPGSGAQQLYGKDNRDLAIRAGASYDLTGRGRTLLRVSYGIFYDRPFDNLWQNLRNNNFIVPTVTLTGATTNFTGPVQATLDSLAGRTLSANFPSLTLMDPNLRNGRVQSYFAGIQHRLAERLTLEVNALGSYGRRLITTDIVNRNFSTAAGRFNTGLPDISYRSGQGFSNYNAMAAVLRYQASRGMLHIAYTWSHAIDNQSDPLTGDFFDLDFTRVGSGGSSFGRATFSRQFDAQADRGSADFDQRHNLVLMYSYALPGSRFLLKDWTVSGLAAFRSGLPYSIVGPTDAKPGQGIVLNNRPDVTNASAVALSADAYGGKLLLNRDAFAPAAASTLGNLGRNTFAGPGFYNFDVALGRSFRLPKLGDATWLRFRADAFNLLNHANLGNPDTLLTSPTFGVAQYGRQGRASGFPAVLPLAEAARQFQMSVRVEF